MKKEYLKLAANAAPLIELVIVVISLAEALIYRGLWNNKIGITLNTIILLLSCLYLAFFAFLKVNGKTLKISKINHFITYPIILTSLAFSITEFLTFPNFIFYYLHINHLALVSLASFLVFTRLLNNQNLLVRLKKALLQAGEAAKQLSLGLIILVPLFSYFIWQQHLNSLNIGGSHTISLATINQTILKNQFLSFLSPGITNNDSLPLMFGTLPVSLGVWYLVSAGLLYLNWLQSQKSKRLGVIIISAYLGACISVIVTIASCVAMFSVGELENTLMRYNLTYLVALVIFSIYIFISNLEKNYKKNKPINLVYLFLLVIMINPKNLTNLAVPNYEMVSKRHELVEKFKHFENNLNQNSAVHAFTNDVVSLRYFVAPIKIISPIWQSGAEFMLSNPEFLRATHVYIDESELIFTQLDHNQIQEIFLSVENVHDNSIYEIIRHDEKTFKLKLVSKGN